VEYGRLLKEVRSRYCLVTVDFDKHFVLHEWCLRLRKCHGASEYLFESRFHAKQ